MKSVPRLLIALFACSAASAQVTPDEHAAHHPPAAAAAPTPAKAPAVPSTGELEQRMTSMQDVMDRLGKVRDPAERQRLLKQHSEAMRAQIRDLMQMECPMKANMGMKGGMMGKGEPDKPGTEPSPMGQGDMMRCHESMKSRMDMMLQMMDQMLQHEDAATAGK